MPFPPEECGVLWIVSRVVRKQNGSSVEHDEIALSLESVIQGRRYVPPAVGARTDQIAIHRPVVILAKRNAVARIIVVSLGKWDQVSRIDNIRPPSRTTLKPQAAQR